METKVKGFYKLKKGYYDEQGNPIINQELTVDNIVTDLGLDALSSGAVASAPRIFIGTGTSTPTPSDTTMGVLVASQQVTNSFASNSGAPDYKLARTYSTQFNAGTLNGNYTELGFSATGSNNAIHSRSLIRDGLGNITALTVLSNEFLTVEYTLEFLPNLADLNGSFNIGSTAYSFVSRASRVDATSAANLSIVSLSAYSGTLGGVTGEPNGTSIARNPSSSVRVSVGVYNHTFVWPVGSSLSGSAPFKSFRLSSSFSDRQIEATPAIPKDNTIQLSLTFRTIYTRV